MDKIVLTCECSGEGLIVIDYTDDGIIENARKLVDSVSSILKEN